MELYMKKTFHKTASLIARSCEANAVLSGASKDLVEAAFQYGRHLGIAFQLVDDLLDFESSSELLGKPGCGADLRLGLATLPVLYATAEYPVELNAMIARRFSEPGDVETAFEMVRKSAGLEKSREEAKRFCDAALKSIDGLKDSQYKSALIDLVDAVLTRKK
jgi:geranylgeranyl pyrophosphate synthase